MCPYTGINWSDPILVNSSHLRCISPNIFKSTLHFHHNAGLWACKSLYGRQNSAICFRLKLQVQQIFSRTVSESNRTPANDNQYCNRLLAHSKLPFQGETIYGWQIQKQGYILIKEDGCQDMLHCRIGWVKFT